MVNRTVKYTIAGTGLVIIIYALGTLIIHAISFVCELTQGCESTNSGTILGVGIIFIFLGFIVGTWIRMLRGET